MASPEPKVLGRRALLAAGAAGVAAVAAQAVVAPARIAAADHDPLKIGETNTGTLTTNLSSTANPTLRASSTDGDGVAGWSSSSGKSGVYGESTSTNGHGVYGQNTPSGNVGYVGGSDDAIQGMGEVDGFAGVRGLHALGSSWGMRAENLVTHCRADLGGPAGVAARAPDGYVALDVDGKALFSRSGILTIGANKSSAKIPDVALTDDSFVIATLRQYRSGVWVAAAQPNVAADSITIYLNKKVTSAIKVGWIVLERRVA